MGWERGVLSPLLGSVVHIEALSPSGAKHLLREGIEVFPVAGAHAPTQLLLLQQRADGAAIASVRQDPTTAHALSIAARLAARPPLAPLRHAAVHRFSR